MTQYGSIQGWISPEGKVYQCGTAEHEAEAEDICRDRGISTECKMAGYGPLGETAMIDYRSGQDALLALGWVHLSERGIWLPQPGDPPLTPAQLSTVFDIAQEYPRMSDYLMDNLRSVANDA